MPDIVFLREIMEYLQVGPMSAVAAPRFVPGAGDLDAMAVRDKISDTPHEMRSNLNPDEEASFLYFQDKLDKMKKPSSKSSSEPKLSAQDQEKYDKFKAKRLQMTISPVTSIHLSAGVNSHYSFNGTWLQAVALVYSGWLGSKFLKTAANELTAATSGKEAKGVVETMYQGAVTALDNVSFFPKGDSKANPDGMTLEEAFAKVQKTLANKAGIVGAAINKLDKEFMDKQPQAWKQYRIGNEHGAKFDALLVAINGLGGEKKDVDLFRQRPEYRVLVEHATKLFEKHKKGNFINKAMAKDFLATGGKSTVLPNPAQFAVQKAKRDAALASTHK